VRAVAATLAGHSGQAILIDIGGVLIPDYLPAAAAEWSTRLGISQPCFMRALFGGNDDQVLIGRVSESSWWSVVGDRLQAGPDLRAELQRDRASRELWDEPLVSLLRGLRGRVRTAIVSNTWPQMRTRMAQAGLLDIAAEVILSCE
jgi:putative hydrolase of the HAD superfamily